MTRRELISTGRRVRLSQLVALDPPYGLRDQPGRADLLTDLIGLMVTLTDPVQVWHGPLELLSDPASVEPGPSWGAGARLTLDLARDARPRQTVLIEPPRRGTAFGAPGPGRAQRQQRRGVGRGGALGLAGGPAGAGRSCAARRWSGRSGVWPLEALAGGGHAGLARVWSRGTAPRSRCTSIRSRRRWRAGCCVAAWRPCRPPVTLRSRPGG